MSMLKIAALVILSFSTVSMEAILPPLYQTSKELRALLEPERLGKALPDGEPILEIRKNKDGFEIVTPRYHVQANVIYKQTGRPGPAQFEIQFADAEKVRE